MRNSREIKLKLLSVTRLGSVAASVNVRTNQWCLRCTKVVSSLSCC